MAKIILVVDDDVDVLETTVNLVQDLGYRAIAAANAKDALRLVTKGGIDAVLSDVMMPGMNGYQLAESLRKVAADLPIICATGYADAFGTPRAGDRRYCNALLRKPYGAAALANTLKSLFAHDGSGRTIVDRDATWPASFLKYPKS